VGGAAGGGGGGGGRICVCVWAGLPMEGGHSATVAICRRGGCKIVDERNVCVHVCVFVCIHVWV